MTQSKILISLQASLVCVCLPWAGTAYGPDREYLEREFSDVLGHTAVVMRADEMEQPGDLEEINQSLQAIKGELATSTRLREEAEIRQEILSGVLRVIDYPTAQSIVLQEVFSGETKYDGEVAQREPFPGRSFVLQKLAGRLPYVHPATGEKLANGFFYYRNSLYLAGMSIEEARFYSDVGTILSRLTPNPVHKQALRESRPYQVPTRYQVQKALDAYESGRGAAADFVVLAEFLSVSDVANLEAETELRTVKAIAQHTPEHGADVIIRSVLRARPGNGDATAVIERLLELLDTFVEQVPTQSEFAERLAGQLMKALVLDSSELPEAAEERLKTFMQRLAERLPPDPEGTAAEHGTAGIFQRVLEQSEHQPLLHAAREVIDRERLEAYSTAGRVGASCPGSFVPRMSTAYGINY